MTGRLPGAVVSVSSNVANALTGTTALGTYPGANAQFDNLQLTGVAGSYTLTFTAEAAAPYVRAPIVAEAVVQVTNCSLTEFYDQASGSCLCIPNSMRDALSGECICTEGAEVCGSDTGRVTHPGARPQGRTSARRAGTQHRICAPTAFMPFGYHLLSAPLAALMAFRMRSRRHARRL